MKWLCLVVLCTLLTPSETGAATHPDEERLVLVHALLGESGWRPKNDQPAILHLFNRRRRLPEHQGKTLTQMAQAYSNFLRMDRPDTPHRKAVFAMTLETAPQWMVRLVDRFLDNPRRVKDPCKGKAWHFGGRFEVDTGNALIVDCGDTANVFLRRAGDPGDPGDAAVP